jgi:hypothetical protein
LIMRSLDFLIVGFSITEQKNSYADYIKAAFSSRPHAPSVASKSVGGASIGFLSYLTPHIKMEDAKFTVFEVASCRRYAGNEPGVYRKHLSLICDAAVKAGSRPCFVNLPRKGYIKPADMLDRTIHEFAEEHRFPCLSLYGDMAEIEARGGIAEYLRDGTHTTQAGSEFYGEKIMAFLENVAAGPHAPSSFSYHPGDGLYPRLWLPSPVGGEYARSDFSRCGISLPAIEIPENSTVTFSVPDGVQPRGLVAIAGPRRGNLRLEANGSAKVVVAYDRDSYYDRLVSLRYQGEPGEMKVTQLPGRPPLTLRKGVPNEAPRIGKILGFLTQTNDADLDAKS